MIDNYLEELDNTNQTLFYPKLTVQHAARRKIPPATGNRPPC